MLLSIKFKFDRAKKTVSVFNEQTPGKVLKSPNVPPQVLDCIKICNINPEKVIGYQVTTSKSLLRSLFGFASKKPERDQVSVTTFENGAKQTYTIVDTPKNP